MKLSLRQITAMVKLALDIADADGQSTDSEYEVMSVELKSFGVTGEECQSVLDEVSEMGFINAVTLINEMDSEQKTEVCAFLAAVMCADGEVGDAEVNLWRNISKWCSFPEMSIDEALKHFRGESATSCQRVDLSNGYYEGELKDGLFDGQGKLFFNDGSRYEGSFSNGKRNGHGVYCWPNGDRYSGNFENSKMAGYGAYYYACGDTFEGQWCNDRRNGFGIYTYKDGGREYGEYKDGVRDGCTVYFSPDNVVRVQQYVNGTLSVDRIYRGFKTGSVIQ